MVRLRLTVLPVAEADIEPIEQTGIYTFQEAVTGLRTPQFHRQKKHKVQSSQFYSLTNTLPAGTFAGFAIL